MILVREKDGKRMRERVCASERVRERQRKRERKLNRAANKTSKETSQ